MLPIATAARGAAFACSVAATSLPHLLGAQSVRGSVVDRGAVPVPGVVIKLVSADSAVVARALTNERGAFLVATPVPGIYRVRTLRIGWRPVTSDPIALGVGQEVVQRFELTGVALALDTVRIGTTNVCRLAGPAATTTFALWEQVRTALAATELTAGTRGVNATTVMFTRRMDAAATRTLDLDARLHSGNVAQPWHSLSPDSLRKVGYVLMDGVGDVTYMAPGLDVLASDRFIGDHCFRIIASRDTARIGIAFEPNAERRSVAEIKGTIWLDRASSELRSIDFRYTNIPALQEQEARGLMDFVRMSDGGWAISRWSIRMPVLGMVSRPRSLGGGQVQVVEIHVAGGELAVARRGTDTLWARDPFTVTATLLDSATGRGVGGARVSVAGTSSSATSGANGSALLPRILPGDHRLQIRTSSLDSIGASHLVPFTLMLADTTLTVRVPTAAQLAGTICSGTSTGVASTGVARTTPLGLVMGAIRAPDGTMPLNAVVVAEWSLGRDNGTRWVEARADVNGGFRLCGMPTTTTILLRAQTDIASATPVGVRIPDGALFVRADMMLDRPAAGSAVFAGTVVTDSADQPIARAEVLLPELGKSTLTSERGLFRLYDIPAGTHRIVVRRVGYGPLDTQIEFGANQSVDRRIVLSSGTVLGTVAVLGASRLPSTFDENRRIGLGHFVTRADLAGRETHPLSQIFRTFPGAGIAGGRGSSAWVMATRVAPSLGGTGIYRPTTAERRQGMPAGCHAKVYVDHVLMNPGSPTEPFDINSFGAEQVEAIEFYASAAQTPMKYATLDSGCGVVVIWRRRF